MRIIDCSSDGCSSDLSACGIWVLPTNTSLRASYGDVFKAPTLYQLFSEYGNVALRPEQAHGWEVGAEQRFLGGRLNLGATYFERTTTDQIIYDSCAPTSADPLCFQPGANISRWGYYQHVSRAEAPGIKFQAAAQLIDGLSIDGSYIWTLAEDRSPGSEKQEKRR